MFARNGRPAIAPTPALDAARTLALVECARFDGGAVGLVYRRR